MINKVLEPVTPCFLYINCKLERRPLNHSEIDDLGLLKTTRLESVLLFPMLGQHVYFETSAVIITLIKLGKMLEARTKGKTGGAIRKLIGLQPKTATVLDNGKEIEIPLTRVKAGNIVIVRPG